jgi:hypothetical protein
VVNIKSLLMAAAVSTAIAFGLPAASHAMPGSSPVKMQGGKGSNLVQVHYKKKWHKKNWHKKRWRESRRWRHHHRRWVRYCDPWDGCYPYYGFGYYDYDYPYYPYYPYGRFYGPGFYGPGIGFHFRID